MDDFPSQLEPQPKSRRYFRFLGNPRWYIWGLVVIFAGMTVYTIFAVQYSLWPFYFIEKIQKVGNDRDAHGCIGSAGYQWCEEKQKCLRTWEELCETTSPLPTEIACTMDAKLCPDGSYVGRTEPNCEFMPCPSN